MNTIQSDIPPDELAELVAMIEAGSWHVTDYIAKHSYITIHKQPELFRKLADAIDKYGYNAKFFKTTYRYLNIGEYRYWHYQIVLNRARFADVPEASK